MEFGISFLYIVEAENLLEHEINDTYKAQSNLTFFEFDPSSLEFKIALQLGMIINNVIMSAT